MGAMRSSLCRISAQGPSEPTATIAVLGTPVAAFLRRAGFGLGTRRPPVARRLPAVDLAALPRESRIVFRGGAIARR
jgi:hypothetical protein